MGFDFLDFGFPKSGTDWKSINGKPSITVSAKGRSNGLSNTINDGADFGPDTTLNATSPNQTGPPYSPYIGIEEAIKYAIANGIGEIRLSDGIFDITNAPFTTDPVTGRKYKLYIPIVNESTTGGNNNPISLNIIGATNIIPSSYWNNIPTPGLRNITTIYDGTVDTTTTNTAEDFIFGVMATPNTSTESPYNFVVLYMDGFVIQTQAEYTSYLGGVDVFNAIQASFGTIKITVISGQTLNKQPATGLMWGNSSGDLALNTANSIDVLGWQDGWISNFSHIYVGYYHAAICINGLSNYGSLGGPQNYSGYIGIVELEHVTNGLNLNTGLLSSGTSRITLGIGSFGTGDLDAGYNYSIISSSSTYGNTVSILIYELGSSGIVPAFSIPNSNDSIRILSWSAKEGNTSAYVPSTVTPTVQASGTAQQNTNPYSVNVYLYGGTVTQLQITRNGTAYTVFSNASGLALSGQVYKLNPSDSITITYTTAPTWEWLSD